MTPEIEVDLDVPPGALVVIHDEFATWTVKYRDICMLQHETCLVVDRIEDEYLQRNLVLLRSNGQTVYMPIKKWRRRDLTVVWNEP